VPVLELFGALFLRIMIFLKGENYSLEFN